MKVQLLVSRCGLEGAQNVGEVIAVSDAEGARMIAAGQAMPERTAKPEKAVKRSKAEKAVKR